MPPQIRTEKFYTYFTVLVMIFTRRNQLSRIFTYVTQLFSFFQRRQDFEITAYHRNIA